MIYLSFIVFQYICRRRGQETAIEMIMVRLLCGEEKAMSIHHLSSIADKLQNGYVTAAWLHQDHQI